MADRFTPEELKQLAEAGELTMADLDLLHPSDAKVAKMFIIDKAVEGQELMGAPLLPPGAVGAISGAGNIGKMIMAAMGLGGGSRATTGPALGQRSAPVAGSRVYGPNLPKRNYTGYQHGPEKPPGMGSVPPGGPQKPSNLERHGNLTRPGPDAHKGGGGPSRPSPGAKIDDPLNRRETFRGPTGNPDNYRTLPGKRDSGRSGSGDESRPGKFAPPHISKGTWDGFDRRRGELLKKFGGRRSTDPKVPTLKTFDEADRRRVVFGGPSSTSRGEYKPADRGPMNKADIQELIQIMQQIAKGLPK